MNFKRTFFIIILFIPYLLLAQDQESTNVPLTYGDNHLAEISELGEIDEYSFFGNTGDVIMLRMRDETKVDAYIRIYDPNGEMIAFKWSDGGHAKIQDLKLELTGTYSILAYDRNHNDIGNYGISLHQLNKNNYSVPLPEIISFTDEIKQIVGVNSYQINVEAGDVFFAQMRAEKVHLECEFFVYNSLGERIAKSANTGRLATIGPVKVEETDTYQIFITDRGGNDIGEFGFTAMLLNKHEAATELVCGDNVQDELEHLVERRAYRLSALPSQIPLIEVRSNNIKLETTVDIYDQSGELVAHSTNTNKIVSHLVLPSTTEESYLVVVYDQNGNDLGNIGVQIQFLDESFCPELLTCDKQNEILTLDGLAQTKLFAINGNSGASINVSLKETDPKLEPHLRVYNMNGELLAQAKDPVMADLSESKYPADGRYLVLAGDVSGNDIGGLELEAPAINLGLEITDCQTVFQGFGPMSYASITVHAEGANLEYIWSNGGTTETIDVAPLETAEYGVTVTNSDGCSEVASTLVEVVDVKCGNENNVKIKVCHVNENNGDHQDKCISENGVWGHLENGEGHTQCYIGSCNYVTICNGENDEGLALAEEVKERAIEKVSTSAMVFPNPTEDVFYIDSRNYTGESVDIFILDIRGELIAHERVFSDGETISLSMKRYKIPGGIYIVKLEGKRQSRTEQILFLK